MDGRPVIPDCWIESRPQGPVETGVAGTFGFENETRADLFVLDSIWEEVSLTPGTAYNTRMMAENEEGPLLIAECGNAQHAGPSLLRRQRRPPRR